MWSKAKIKDFIMIPSLQLDKGVSFCPPLLARKKCSAINLLGHTKRVSVLKQKPFLSIIT